MKRAVNSRATPVDWQPWPENGEHVVAASIATTGADPRDRAAHSVTSAPAPVFSVGQAKGGRLRSRLSSHARNVHQYIADTAAESGPRHDPSAPRRAGPQPAHTSGVAKGLRLGGRSRIPMGQIPCTSRASRKPIASDLRPDGWQTGTLVPTIAIAERAA